ncbi:MAG: CYTH domain-containing protein [Bacteroidota bacterium]
MKEIERKFLVNKEMWKSVEKPKPIYIKQGYISKAEKGVVRIRIKDEKAFLTIKSATFGITRSEYEYEVPMQDVEEMFSLFCDKFIEKYRYEVLVFDKLWEVDEFIQPQKNFILAEIELSSENEAFSLPEWIEKEVSDNPIYFNSNFL